ncbi:MAG: glycosyltransferase family 2 protein [Mycobacterium sp.]|nr:glycosyltransferase family 2 protein [Mycobacterium sp.]
MTDLHTGLVAAVIPARPNEPFLAEALNSVLHQPEVSDIVVATHVDDSPTAQLAADHPDLRIRLVISDGPSAGANLNAGIAATDSVWLAFLDADDCWPAGRVAASLRAANSVPGTQLVLGQQRAMDVDGVLMTDVQWSLLGAALVTRDAANRIGPFDTDMIGQMRWVLRARDLGVPTVELAEVLLHRREHSANLSRLRRSELHKAYLALARERAAQQRNTRRST